MEYDIKPGHLPYVLSSRNPASDVMLENTWPSRDQPATKQTHDFLELKRGFCVFNPDKLPRRD
jgi:hypothetical protein